MRLDAHQHFWRYDAERDAWITGEMRAIRRDFLPVDLEGVLSHNHMDGCIAVQADQSEDETRFLLDLAHRHAFIKGVVGWVDLLSPNLDERLDIYCADPLLRGVRHVAQAEPDDFLAREEVIRGIASLARVGLTYDILVYAHQLPAAITLVSRLSEQPFVLDHLAKPRIRDAVMDPWATDIRELARRPNVCCKISGLVTEADWNGRGWRVEHLVSYLDVVFDAFGPHRVMWGSDWPVCLVAAPYERVLEIVDTYTRAFTASERDALFGGNAARFYRIDHATRVD